MKKIGFIGTGVMGAAIVKHLLNAEYSVNVYNRTKSKTNQLVELGAVWKDSPKEVAETSDIIFTMVGYPKDVETIYFGKNGIFEADVTNSIMVDLTTSTPSLAEELYKKAKSVGADSLDAPVSGGDLGAQNGTLTIMVGGDNHVYEKVLPLFNIFGSKVICQGSAGCGQHTKMANQIMIAGTMTGMTELLVYAKAAGLNLDKVLDTVGGGSAANWSLTNYAPRVLKKDYSAGFFVKHFVKDLKIALDESKKMDVPLPATEKAYELYKKLENEGHGDDGTQSLIKLWWED
ncbi:NAD(P)-dependent oxidoreductase [Vagococcus vulneris]|uniref:Oxidoreductase n=1 Tax=Vagococcus vulneris TaxID=1977869 RepID=A0A429ZTB7_9ENTE|nr:NAD(P)-dependent oxidoreductase [Vagococcus vulneris]RST96926.1 oxidoreductase [Vagococcus vulneris]